MLRHDLVYLHPEAAWDSPCAAAGSPLWQAAERWIAGGRPLVVARQPDDQVLLLGLALPLAFNRQRLSILVAPSAVARCRPALTVADCLPHLPADQAAPLRELAGRAEACSAMLGVYGSLAWEALSGEAYRHAGSDIDLICDVATPAQFDTMLAALQRAAEGLSCQLDGEIRFPDGRAVAWREIVAKLKTPAAPVLVKGAREVGLQPLENLVATLLPEPCHV
ncbi:malonate decarboxylase holo-[acyl-carrier-protein] synthase [Azonexus hydrophilus]|uniref:Malonate decarboxylase holo-[acyl-carrier-protein] synthase n=1 Tax=Azonexus hydrophilus TaxID=418702 RepID=A0ABZ2XJN4_9RHOO